MSTQSGPGPPAGERLARLEAKIEELVNALDRTHADLREHLEWQRRSFTVIEKRMNLVEREQDHVRVHLKWMKAVWTVVQGAIMGWIGLK